MAAPTSTSSTTKQNKSAPSCTKFVRTPKKKTPTKEPVQQKSTGIGKATDSPSTTKTAQKKSKVLSGKKSTSAGKPHIKSPNTAMQTDMPNVYLVSQNREQLATLMQLSLIAADDPTKNSKIILSA